MDTILMNSENSKASDTHRLLLNLLDKINLKRSDIYMLLYQTLAFSIHGKIFKKSCKNNKSKISSPKWNEEFDLADGLPDDNFEHIIKQNETVTNNPSVMIYVNKIETRKTFTIKTGYYLELLRPEQQIYLEALKAR